MNSVRYQFVFFTAPIRALIRAQQNYGKAIFNRPKWLGNRAACVLDKMVKRHTYISKITADQPKCVSIKIDL